MYQIDDPTCSAAEPALPTDAVVTPGWFTGGNPAAATPATRVRYWWLNMIQDELVAIVQAADLALAKGVNTQVLAALRLLFMPRAQTLGNSVEHIFVPPNNSSYTASFSFTCFVPGVLHAVTSANLAGVSPSTQGLALDIDGVNYAGDTTYYSMTESATVALTAGAHTVTSTLTSPGSSNPSVGLSLSYIFVPS